MPETQQPFVQQHGAPPRRPTIGDLLTPASIDRGIRLLARGSAVTPKAAIMADTAELLAWLKQPSINTTLAALFHLQPSEADIVNQVAIALLHAGKKRPRLIAELRAALDAVP
jgi:hypothetical protein